MKECHALIALFAALLLCVPAVRAQDAENAKTPTALADLLPKEGLGEGVDFCLLMSSPDDQGGMFMRWTIKPDGDKIVCTVMAGGGEGGFNYSSTTTLVYTKAGELLSYEEVTDFGGNASTKVGTVRDGKLIMSSAVIEGDDGPKGGVPAPEVTEVDLKKLEGMLPMQWLPLVFGYHIREGNLGYTVKMFDHLEYAGKNTMSVEDNGTEKVEFNGAEHEVHSLQITSKTEFDQGADVPIEGPGEVKMRALVLKDGTIFSLDMNEGRLAMKAKRVTAEEFAEAQKKIKAAAPEQPDDDVPDGEVEDTVEEGADE